MFGGIHATLYPEEASALGGAHAVVKGDGDLVWARVIADCGRNAPLAMYDGGKVEGGDFKPARWSLMPPGQVHVGVGADRARLPEALLVLLGVEDRRPAAAAAHASTRSIDEIVDLRRRGFRFIALADDNFYPVTLEDLAMASRRQDKSRLEELKAMRAERFELMEGLAALPDDMVFFTQITMEAAEDPEFLAAMKKARIKGALVGVEAVTPEGLKDVYKDFNCSGEHLVDRLRAFRHHGVHVLGSFIFGLPSDRPETFDLTARSRRAVGRHLRAVRDADAVSRHGRLRRVGKVDGIRIRRGSTAIPLTRHWLIPKGKQPKVYVPHPMMSADDIRARTQGVWDRFYSWRNIWARSHCVESLKSRLAFVLISKLYRQMYANTGIATDSARINRSATWARLIAKPCQRLFAARPMPDLKVPRAVSELQEV